MRPAPFLRTYGSLGVCVEQCFCAANVLSCPCLITRLSQETSLTPASSHDFADATTSTILRLCPAALSPWTSPGMICVPPHRARPRSYHGRLPGHEGFKTFWSARFSTANACQLPPVKPQNRAISLAAHTSAATTKSPACPQDGVPPVRMGKACARPSTSTLSTRVTPAPSM